MLTRGYARPSSLGDSADIFTRVLPSLDPGRAGESSIQSGRQVLVVGLEADQRRIAWLILIGAFLGLIVGVTVGIVSEDARIGAGVGGAAFGAIAIFEGAMVLMYK